jgi:hypothetical protein
VKNVLETKVTVSVSIADDRANINITINGQQFAMNWDPAKEFLNYRV